MGLRIREHQHRRRLENERNRREILKTEAQKFHELKWFKEQADEEFLEKLSNIRELIKSNDKALQLADKLEQSIHQRLQPSPIHKDLLASIILDLL